MQVKWCSMKDEDADGYGPWPWAEQSTAYNLDFYGAVIRGCLEGWDTWLGPDYVAGDLWGCVGRWFAGAWHSPDAENYIAEVQAHMGDAALAELARSRIYVRRMRWPKSPRMPRIRTDRSTLTLP